MRQPIWHQKTVDLLLDALTMVWLLDADGGQILGRHAADSGKIVSGCCEQIGVLSEAAVAQPVVDLVEVL